MKNSLIWVLAALVIAIALVVEMRFTLTIDSPIVARLDRITGSVAIANKGEWVQVKDGAGGCWPCPKMLPCSGADKK